MITNTIEDAFDFAALEMDEDIMLVRMEIERDTNLNATVYRGFYTVAGKIGEFVAQFKLPDYNANFISPLLIKNAVKTQLEWYIQERNKE